MVATAAAAAVVVIVEVGVAVAAAAAATTAIYVIWIKKKTIRWMLAPAAAKVQRTTATTS